MLEMGAIAGLTSFAVLLAVAAGLFRAVRGPSFHDRLLGMLFAGTGAAALLVLMATLSADHGLLDAALALIFLAPILTVACVAQVRANGDAER